MTAVELYEWTWPSDQPARADDAFRQHRCGQPADHDGRCRCRYCERRVPTLGGRP